jgi:SAM-dependent methyltransferase
MQLIHIVILSLLNQSIAFHKFLHRPIIRTPITLAAKSICTFDSTDFAGKQGDWPYTAADLNRLDNSIDSSFYNEPRFVTHIDDRAIELLTDFYREEFTAAKKKEPLDILDLCSSWISHLPTDLQYGRVAGVGMNEKELEANKQLTEYYVQDLNQKPALSQFEDNSFDVICNVVSVDYLTKPLEIFQEMHRILRPGGISLMSFSNRCFPSKAVAMWLQADDIGRLTIVASYYHYAAQWESIEALDLKEMQATPSRPSAGEVFKNPASLTAWMNTAAAVAKNNSGDPMFVVKGVK